MTTIATMEIDRRTIVQIPSVPNYLILTSDSRLRAPGGKLPVGHFTDEELREVAMAWLGGLLRRAAEQRGAQGGES